jgi:propionyl-CoA synthetase
MWSSLFRQKISRTSTGFNSIRNKFTMKYEEFNPKHRPPEAFGQHRPMKLNGIVNRKRFCRKMKMDIHFGKDDELNICYLALDKHIQDGYGDQTAFIYDSQ